MKIAILQCNSVAGDIDGNAARILAAAHVAAEQGASLCVTPELALSGVMPRNLLNRVSFVDACQAKLTEMAKSMAQGPALLVGSPVPNALGLCKTAANAAVLLQGGLANVVSRKVFHAHGEAGDDARYFERGVSCGLSTLEGWRFGVVLCEETWGNNSFWKISHVNAYNPLMELVARGVDAIIHLGASFFDMRDEGNRKNMLSHVAARHHVHLFSTNVVGGNDDAVYHGQSLVFSPTGALLACGKTFAEDIVMLDTTSGVPLAPLPFLPVSAEQACWQALVLGTRDYVRKSGFTQVVLGLSGGMDSALVAAVAVEALGPENVLGVLLPSPHTSQESTNYALQLAKNLGISTHTIPIAPLMRSFEEVLCPVLGIATENCLEAPGLTFENIQARIRGNILMALANYQRRIVLNTGNKSEAAMGYCTLYGDAVGAIAVLGDLSKTDVYRLARWYNSDRPSASIPQEIIDRPPTAELRPGQLDSDSMPPYDILDPMLDKLMSGLSFHEGEEDAPDAEGEGLSLEGDVYAKLLRAEFKRRQAPMPLRMNRLCFGTGWRVPVVLRYSVDKV
ncbi:MAG: NAD+ synthase [Desulfovibrionaceae bacterium]